MNLGLADDLNLKELSLWSRAGKSPKSWTLGSSLRRIPPTTCGTITCVIRRIRTGRTRIEKKHNILIFKTRSSKVRDTPRLRIYVYNALFLPQIVGHLYNIWVGYLYLQIYILFYNLCTRSFNVFITTTATTRVVNYTVSDNMYIHTYNRAYILCL